MNTADSHTFIRDTLLEISDHYQIPENLIDPLIALLEKYPDMSVRGAKKGLRDELETQINYLKQQGQFQ